MKNRINKTITTFIALLLMSTSVAVVEAQQTDREIPQQFLQEYQEVEGMINDAETMQDLRTTMDRVNRLLNDYRDHASVINRAIHPETISGKFEDLRVKFTAMQSKIRTIQRQNRSIDRLRSELSRTRDRLGRYDHHISWLLGRVSELEERALQAEAGTGENLNAALRERDRFVTEFLTDLLERYESVDAVTQEEMNEIFDRLQDTPVDMLRTILGEYQMNAQQTTGRTPTELLNMKAQHAYFSNWWNKFGDRLIDTFESDQPEEARSEINEQLSSWSAAIDDQLWDAISETYSENGFDLPAFGNSQEFYNAQTNFIREQTETVSSQASEENRERFRAYSEFWNESVKSEWGEALTASEVMNHSQIANIDRLITDWSQAAVPPQTGGNLMTILFFVSLAVNIGLAVVLVRRNNSNTSTEMS